MVNKDSCTYFCTFLFSTSGNCAMNLSRRWCNTNHVITYLFTSLQVTVRVISYRQQHVLLLIQLYLPTLCSEKNTHSHFLSYLH